MTETTATPGTPTPPRPRRRWLRRAAVAGVLVVVAGAGLATLAHGHGRWHRGGGLMGGPVDPARLDEHVDRMLKHVAVEVDATEAQKQALAPIAKAAARDLLPLRERFRDGRRQAIALLSAPTVDRAAIETLRATQLALADEASRRIAQALADAADVLTPEQRMKLAERAARWQERHRG